MSGARRNFTGDCYKCLHNFFGFLEWVRAREVALESIQLSSGVDASGLARIAANATNPPRGHVD